MSDIPVNDWKPVIRIATIKPCTAVLISRGTYAIIRKVRGCSLWFITAYGDANGGPRMIHIRDFKSVAFARRWVKEYAATK